MPVEKLKIVLFRQTCRTQYENDCLAEILRGFLVCGDDASISDSSYLDCDVAVVMYSPRLGKFSSTRACRRIRNLHPKNLLILEMPIFRDTKEWYCRLGFDHVHGGGRFSAGAVDDKRFESLGLTVKPWKTSGEAIIVASQINDDYSLDGIDIDEWTKDVANFLVRRNKLDIAIRPHPLARYEVASRGDLASEVQISDYTLEEDLKRAWRWVSFTSGSSIDAVLSGVPSVTLSRNNFAWEVSSHNICNLEHPATPDRRDWLNRLAYSQWKFDEIADGVAWRHIRPLVD